MKFTFPKKERLKRQKLIEQLFSEGLSVTVLPLKLVYIKADLPEKVPVQAGFSASKKSFRHSVYRNRIKRLMRETYRLNKAIIFNNSKTQYAFMFLYLGKELPDFHTLHTAMKTILERFKGKELLK